MLNANKEKLTVLFLASEVEGLIKTGGLADVARALPEQIQAMGHDVHLVCPCYPQLMPFIDDTNSYHTELSLQLGSQHYLYRVHHLNPFGVKVHAIDYTPYFHRERPYDDGQQGYADNGERFAFFTIAALQMAQMLGIQPDIIHGNDWHCALAPFVLKTLLKDNQFYAKSKTLLTLHNAAYQGVYDLSGIHFHHLFNHDFRAEMFEGFHQLNFLKVGVLYADKINAVSQAYADELISPMGGHGIYPIFKQRKSDLVGILNGCNYDDWDPQHDHHLPHHFSAADLSGKHANKAALQAQFELPTDADKPLFGMVSRFTNQKGFSLLLPALEAFLPTAEAQFIIVGSGDRNIAHQLHQLAERYPNKLSIFEGYSEELSHLVQAGSDFFLVPSIFEPCGLTQMFSLAYGSLPVVRSVGGLKDTVHPYHEDPLTANGIRFNDANPQALTWALKEAIKLYQNKKEYSRIQQQAMLCRFEWSSAAEQYVQLYQQMKMPIKTKEKLAI